MFRKGDKLSSTLINTNVRDIIKNEVRRSLGSKVSTSAPLLRIHNTSATDLIKGKAIAIIGGNQEEKYYSFEGYSITDSDDYDLIGFVSEDIPSAGVGTFQLWGKIQTDITVNDALHLYAKPIDGGHDFETTEDKTRFRVIKNETGTPPYSSSSLLIVFPPSSMEGDLDDVPYLYDCDCSVIDTETWKRGNPDTDNPTNPDTSNPLIGFEVKIVTDVCYDATIGKFTKTHRTFTFDSAGVLKEMSAETESDITTTAGCT